MSPNTRRMRSIILRHCNMLFGRVVQKSQRDEIIDDNREILAVIASLGGDKAKYRRERMRGLKAIVSEISSPPRVT